MVGYREALNGGCWPAGFEFNTVAAMIAPCSVKA